MATSITTILDELGVGFCRYALMMLIQSSILIAALLVIELLLRRRVRAVIRYSIWMLVFVKLVLPPTLCLPTGAGYWLGDYLLADSGVLARGDSDRSEAHKMSISAFVVPADSYVTPSYESGYTVAAFGVDDSRSPGMSRQTVVFLVWLVGVLVLSVLLLQRIWFVQRLVAQSDPVKGGLADRLNVYRHQMGIRRSVELRISQAALSPATCGLLRPKILLSASMLARLSADKLRTVLIHELAHIKRGDLWANFAQNVLQVIYFYNPLLWLANAVVRRIREQAVDEMVLASLGDQAKSYSKTLIDIAEMAFLRPSLGLRLIGVVESRKALAGRIRHITTRPFPKTARLGIRGLAAVLIIAAVLLPMAKAEKTRLEITIDGDLESRSASHVLPKGWSLDYDSGIGVGAATHWRPGMARNLAELRVTQNLLDPRDLRLKQEEYEFRVHSMTGQDMGRIPLVGGDLSNTLTLQPQKYLLTYTRRRGRHPDNLSMECGEFLVDLGSPGMYELKFTPKLGTADISGSNGGCYAVNFEKIGLPHLQGFHYQYPAKRYLLDGLLAGTYALSAVTQLQGDNVFVSRAQVTVEDGQKVIQNIQSPALGGCLLRGTILGTLSKPRGNSSPQFEWFVLIRTPESGPVVTADVYEVLTMDTIYVVRGRNIVKETEERARYSIEGIAAGEYNVTVIEHDLTSGAPITRQQSKPLIMRSDESVALDFDLSATPIEHPENRIDSRRRRAIGPDASVVEQSDTPVTRVYDISGLFGEADGAVEGKAEDVQNLMNLIVDTIEPDSWYGTGTGEGTITSYEDKNLIILQSPAIHKKIETVLNEMRAALPAQISVEARFVTVSDEFLESMGADGNCLCDIKVAPDRFNSSAETRPKPFAIEFGGEDANAPVGESGSRAISKSSACLLDDLQAHIILVAVRAHKDSKVLAAPKVMVLAGESAELRIGTEAAYILGYAEPNSPSGRPEPKYERTPIGTKLQVLPQVAADGVNIELKVDFEVSDLIGFEEHLYKGEYAYQIPLMDVVSSSATVLMADGATVLIGGKKITVENEDGQRAEKNLLVLIKAQKVEPGQGGYSERSETRRRSEYQLE